MQIHIQISYIDRDALDSETYHLKFKEYNKRQREIMTQMKAHVKADET
jgi:hypothetical protein